MKTKSSRCLWLTLKLIRHQKLRTAAVFCGMLFSVFLLGAFAGFGYDFWIQVHGGTGEAAEYDRTQLILIALLTVLLLLVTACSGILLHNLYALTSVQRQRSLIRLSALGASTRDILVMTLQENLIFSVSLSRRAVFLLGCPTQLPAYNPGPRCGSQGLSCCGYGWFPASAVSGHCGFPGTESPGKPIFY